MQSSSLLNFKSWKSTVFYYNLMGRCITFFFLCRLLTALPPCCHHRGRQRGSRAGAVNPCRRRSRSGAKYSAMTQILWWLGLGCGWGQICAWGERDVDGGWGTWSLWSRKQVVDGGCVQAAVEARVGEIGGMRGVEEVCDGGKGK